jgi:hypothetical protein
VVYDDRPVETPEFSLDKPGVVELSGISYGRATDRQRTHAWDEEFFDSFARFHVLTNMLHHAVSRIRQQQRIAAYLWVRSSISSPLTFLTLTCMPSFEKDMLLFAICLFPCAARSLLYR